MARLLGQGGGLGAAMAEVLIYVARGWFIVDPLELAPHSTHISFQRASSPHRSCVTVCTQTPLFVKMPQMALGSVEENLAYSWIYGQSNLCAKFFNNTS